MHRFLQLAAIAACVSSSLALAACAGATVAPVAPATAAPSVTIAAPATLAATATPVAATATTAPEAAATATPAATEAAAAPAASFKPAKRSVWETTAGPDQLKGDCPAGSVVPPYGPVLITPNAAGFEWKDVQNSIYAFTGSADGGFVYAGPNGRKDGVITMTLRFDNATQFAMQAELVKTDSPACAHVYDYKGVFKFDR